MTLDTHLTPTGTVLPSAWNDTETNAQVQRFTAQHPEGNLLLSGMMSRFYVTPTQQATTRINTYIQLRLADDQVAIETGETQTLRHISPAGLDEAEQDAYHTYRQEGAEPRLAAELALSRRR